jgi:hypothetical protein
MSGRFLALHIFLAGIFTSAMVATAVSKLLKMIGVPCHNVRVLFHWSIIQSLLKLILTVYCIVLYRLVFYIQCAVEAMVFDMTSWVAGAVGDAVAGGRADGTGQGEIPRAGSQEHHVAAATTATAAAAAAATAAATAAASAVTASTTTTNGS